MTAPKFVNRIQDYELQLVRCCCRIAGSSHGRFMAIALSKMGNGWIYVPLTITLLAVAGQRAWPVVVAAGISIAAGQGLLALLKRHYQRIRPYEISRDLECLLPVQDRNSFPSGHMMTLTAVMIPTILVFPAAVWFAGLFWSLMAWSRLACAHHYPSDVAAGTVLGFVIAYPVSIALLNAVPS